jgi:hypothetical protein
MNGSQIGHAVLVMQSAARARTAEVRSGGRDNRKWE